VLPLHLIVAALFGWLEREQRDVIEFLREENRLLKTQLQGRRLRLNDDERRRLAVIGQRLGRRILADVATIVTPDTILRWHRELIARKLTHVTSRPGRPGVQVEIRRLVVRMATDNPSWGYTRIQGALKNLGHRVARSTIAKILKEEGIPPSRERPMTWRTFLCAHWHALLAADFFTTEVWTVRGLVTYYTAFVIELHSRRVHNRVIPLGERHLRRTLAEFMAHYHGERNHQGLGNDLIERPPRPHAGGPVHRRQRLSGLLSYYYCAAA
jgi:putative transposase